MHGEGQALALRFFEVCDQAIANYRRLRGWKPRLRFLLGRRAL